jgi:hypothetical protein
VRFHNCHKDLFKTNRKIAKKLGEAVEISPWSKLDYPCKYTNKGCSFVSKAAKAELHEMETNFLNSHRRLIKKL